MPQSKEQNCRRRGKQHDKHCPFILFTLFLCVRMYYVCMYLYFKVSVWACQKTTCRDWFSSSTMLVLRTKLESGITEILYVWTHVASPKLYITDESYQCDSKTTPNSTEGKHRLARQRK